MSKNVSSQQVPSQPARESMASRIVLHWTYLEVAWANLELARSADARSLLAVVEKDNTRWSPSILQWHYGERKAYAVLTCIVFSAMTLEAYINNLARRELSAFYRDSLDKLDLAAKWVMIPKAAFNLGFEPSDSIIGQIDELQKMRNFFVHAKPVYFNCEHRPPGTAKYHLHLKRAELAFKSCTEALEAILRIHPRQEDSGYEEFAVWKTRIWNDDRKHAAMFEMDKGLSPL